MVEELRRISGQLNVSGIALSFPGPFIYDKGICGIHAQCKYDHFFGADLKTTLRSQLNGLAGICKPSFINDADAFLLGAVNEYGWQNERVLAITLGTGLGGAYYDHRKLLDVAQMPGGGELYNTPYQDGIAEDYISSRWILKRYQELTGNKTAEVKDIASLSDEISRQVFAELGEHLAAVLSPVIREFLPTGIVFGGNISKAFALFKEPFIDLLSMNHKVTIRVAGDTSGSDPATDNAGNNSGHVIDDTSALSVKGAVAGHLSQTRHLSNPPEKRAFRKTHQPLLPLEKGAGQLSSYDLFPTYPLDAGLIQTGYASLAENLSSF